MINQKRERQIKYSVLLIANLILPLIAYQAMGEEKNILSMQASIQYEDFVLADGSQAQLVNLNPSIGAWYLLQIKGGPLKGGYHLEVVQPTGTQLKLTASGLKVTTAEHESHCDIFNSQDTHYLANLKAASGRFVRLCETNVSLRSNTGKNIVDEKTAQLFFAKTAPVPADAKLAPQGAEIKDSAKNQKVKSGIAVDVADETPGTWAPSKYHAGVYVSTLVPGQISQNLLSDGAADNLNSSEAGSKVTLVALSLNDFTVGWSHGPLLPGIGHWGKMFPFASAPSAEGPEGFKSFQPLNALTGIMNPLNLPKFEAAMCGGFQRHHGWMRRAGGPNSGKYYGFIQEGVILSKMNSGLVTLIVYADGSVTIKTWEDTDNKQINEIRYARQNGVPIVQKDQGHTRPMAYVHAAQRFFGNWSGSADGNIQTPRSGVCLAENNGNKFLIYGFFNSATPSAMARVFQAYGCETAMHLDMNNPEWAYFALFSNTSPGNYIVEHASPAMKPKDGVLNIGGKNITMPRFIAHPDNANPGDLFYFLRK